jgi:hypothetical protein
MGVSTPVIDANKKGYSMTTDILNLRGQTRERVCDNLDNSYRYYGWNSTLALALLDYGIPADEFMKSYPSDPSLSRQENDIRKIHAIVNRMFERWERLHPRKSAGFST